MHFAWRAAEGVGAVMASEEQVLVGGRRNRLNARDIDAITLARIEVSDDVVLDTGQGVGDRPVDEKIGTLAARQNIVTRSAPQHIVAVAARQEVAARPG